jgi:CubicO group peptidase (beta-lactamase class C family)
MGGQSPVRAYDRPRLRRLIVCLLVVACAALAAPGAASAALQCSAPGGDWTRRAPAQENLDSAKVQAAIDYAMSRQSDHVAIYRHGCLVAEANTQPPDHTFQSYSMAKSVTSIGAGAAITKHLLAPDDRVGGLIREADRPHGALPLRNLLEQNSGLHWNFFRDYNVFQPRDRVRDALALPFDHAPATFFEYAQSPVALAAEMVSRATGQDIVPFIQHDVFDRIGIPAANWSWGRDNAGHVQGFFDVQMRAHDWARLGHLMLWKGRWGGKRILSRRYVREATAPSPTNGGYGWYFWVNRGRSFVEPTADRRDVRDRRIVESAPPDMFLFAGLLEQRIIVIPSLDMVLVRLGVPGSRSGESDPFSLLLTTGPAEFDHEFTRLVMRAVTDVHVPDPGPYQARGPQETAPDPNYGFLKSARETNDLDEADDPSPPLPPPGPPRARATHVLTQRARLRGRHVNLDLSCPPVAALPCKGLLDLSDSGGRLLRRKHFDLVPGERERLKLNLKRSVRRRLRHHSISGRSRTFTEDSLSGTLNSESLKLLPPRRRHRH